MSKFEKQFEETKALSGVSFPKIDAEGSYTVKILSAEFVKTLAGTASQGKVQVEVTEGEKETARCNLYIGAGKTDEQGIRNAKPFYDTLRALGVPASKIEDDCDTLIEVIQSIVTLLAKRVLKGETILMTLNVRKNVAKSTELKTEFYFNPAVYAPIDPIDNAPAVENDPF